MGTIGDWGSGATPAKGNSGYYVNGIIPWLTTGELNDSFVYDTKTKVTTKALQECSLRKCKKGDVLIAMYGATIGKVAIAGCELTTNQACCACTLHYSYNLWLFYYLMANKLNFTKMGEGGAQPNISKEKIVKTLIAMPPVEEQKKIVTIIDQLLPKVEKYNKCQSSLDNLNFEINIKMRKSILQEAIMGKLVPQIAEEGDASILLQQIEMEKQKFAKEGKLKKKDLASSCIYRGDDNKYYEKCGKDIECVDEIVPYRIPDTWRWIRLGTLFQHNTGKTLNASNKTGELKPYLTTSNLYWNRFQLENLRKMYFNQDEILRYSVKKGDLLVCEGGDVGRAAIWNYDYEICIQNHIHKLRPYIPINTEFYYHVFYYLKNMGHIGGKGIGIQGLSSGALDKLLLPMPPLGEQNRIVKELSELTTKLG